MKDKQKNTKQKIFDAAVELFSRKGYAGTSIREIAYAVGIKESSIYNHYKSKEEILQSIFDYFQSGITSMRPSEKELVKIIDAIVPAEIIKLIFLNYGKSEDIIADRIARIIFTEQYINERARDFVLNYMIKEPIEYYKNVFSMMARANRIKDADYTVVTEELHFGFLGIIINYLHVKKEGQYNPEMIQKMVRHVDFIFEHIEKI